METEGSEEKALRSHTAASSKVPGLDSHSRGKANCVEGIHQTLCVDHTHVCVHLIFTGFPWCGTRKGLPS